MNYIGIDIGKKGAIAVIGDNGIMLSPMPMIANELDFERLHLIMQIYAGTDSHVVFEKLGLIYQSSKATAFSMGFQSGAVEMVCIALGIPYTKVRAVDWQKEMFQGVDEIKVTRKDKMVRDTKAMALIAAKRLYPKQSFIAGRARKDNDGMIDALLMADYLKRRIK